MIPLRKGKICKINKFVSYKMAGGMEMDIKYYWQLKKSNDNE